MKYIKQSSSPTIIVLQSLGNTFLHSFFSMAQASAVAAVTIDVHKAKDLVHSGYRYLDVRTPEEFKNGHLDVENIVNIPYMFKTPEGWPKNPQFVEQVSSTFSKDDHLVVNCERGVRSAYATTDLQNVGFVHVKNMGGGYAAWVENGLSVKKPQEEMKQQEL
ncbi:hypothetical protein NE237_018070 [Protea cynaroides]|uniref:Rhodanese domain-containing protein n=1 Tax=Protea cynaroides TaxID=273540 RepID=A0A9Q0K971_9MAGN|nr:hypothetical protein NE237_018070 [Protea cynaroides]